MKKSQKVVKINNDNVKKINRLFIFLLLLIFALIIRVGYLQFVKGDWLSKQANAQQTTTETIQPDRGTIYDANGKVLAISAEVDTVSVNPSKLKYSNNEPVTKDFAANAFSNIFGLDYTETLDKLNSATSYVTIASKVENDKIDLLRDWMKSNKVTSGINIDSTIKRYYPYNNLASHLIGFTGTDTQRIIWFRKFIRNNISWYGW